MVSETWTTRRFLGFRVNFCSASRVMFGETAPRLLSALPGVLAGLPATAGLLALAAVALAPLVALPAAVAVVVGFAFFGFAALGMIANYSI
jgi:hypothetical protein